MLILLLVRSNQSINYRLEQAIIRRHVMSDELGAAIYMTLSKCG